MTHACQSFASLLDALTSKKGAALLVPAILLVGATLAIGQSSGHPRRWPNRAAGEAAIRAGADQHGYRAEKPSGAFSRPSARTSRPSSRITCSTIPR